MATKQLNLVQTSIGKKLLMGLTGLFLCVFLIAHLVGNLQLFIGGEAGQLQFNDYTKFMTSNPLIKVLSYVTYFFILWHAFEGIWLSIRKKKTRPQGYVMAKPAASSTWSSRNMGILGTFIFAFIIIHMSDFWYQTHWGPLGNDANGNIDIHTRVVASFQQWWYVALYVLSMIAISFHLVHGFQSGFQTLGFNHERYTPLIKKTGIAFSILIPLIFALIPIYIFFAN